MAHSRSGGAFSAAAAGSADDLPGGITDTGKHFVQAGKLGGPVTVQFYAPGGLHAALLCFLQAADPPPVVFNAKGCGHLLYGMFHSVVSFPHGKRGPFRFTVKVYYTAASNHVIIWQENGKKKKISRILQRL